MDGMIAAGRVGGLFGNRGELSLVLYDSWPRDFKLENPVFVEIDGHGIPLFFERFARRGVRGATAVFADIDTTGRAEELVGRTFFIRAAGVAGAAGADGEVSGDEIYFEDLVGWEAEVGRGPGANTPLVGRVTAFFDSELNPLLEISLDGQTELIPAVEEFIAGIDEQRRRVTFDLPDGLLGLNG
jgi:16S rRNA processing protein RimM